MARKVEYEKDYIINKSIDFLKEKGIDKLSSRELTKYIGCSTQPIFRIYNNMDIYKKDLKSKLTKNYNNFTKQYNNDFLYINYAYAMYAKKENSLFKALFISDLSDKKLIKNDKNIINNIKREYRLSDKKAEAVYRDVKIYTHGIATQLCFKNMNISDKDLLFLINNCIKRSIKE